MAHIIFYSLLALAKQIEIQSNRCCPLSLLIDLFILFYIYIFLFRVAGWHDIKQKQHKIRNEKLNEKSENIFYCLLL